MHVILGAGGVIGIELVRELLACGERVRLVGRAPILLPGVTEVLAADLTDPRQTVTAVQGARTVHLVVGLKYELRVWQEQWPRIMHNTIEACKQASARLIFFDNVYMYGRVEGPMTEDTPFNPCSKKGEIRAAIATNLLDEIKAGALTALIARSADFYGPAARNSVANMLVMDKLASGRRPMCLANAHLPHSYTYTPDAAKSLVLLAKDERAWNQTWHLPTAANPPSGHDFIGVAAKEFGLAPKYSVLSPALIWIAGRFDGNVRSSHEMLYQNRFPYLFNSEKFNRRYNFTPTPYTEGIRMTAAAYRHSA